MSDKSEKRIQSHSGKHTPFDSATSQDVADVETTCHSSTEGAHAFGHGTAAYCGPASNVETTRIHFHVIADSEFKYQRKKAKIKVCFKRRKDQPESSYELTKVRDIEDGFCLMTGAIDIPVCQLREGKLQYKYFLIREDNPQTKIFEDIRDDGDRELIIPNSQIHPKGTVHIYDGIMKRTLSSGWVFYPSYETDIIMALKEMMPSWEGLCKTWKNIHMGETLTAEEVITYIKNLRKSLEKWPVCCNEKKDKLDIFFSKALGNYFEERLTALQEPYKTWSHTEKETPLHVASVMCMVVLTDLFQVPLSIDQNKRILRALQIQPVEKEQIREQFLNSLTVHFPTKRNLPKHLMAFIMRYLSHPGADSTWFACVPLLHFLQGKCQPWEIPDHIYDEDHSTGRWWGVPEMTDIVEKFKKNFTIPIPLEILVPCPLSLYEVDWLLPRTILASLSHEHIPNILASATMPPEAVVAMVFHHINAGNGKPEVILEGLPSFIERSKYHKVGLKHYPEVVVLTRKICMEILNVVIKKKLDHYSYVPMMKAAVKAVEIEKDMLKESERTPEGLDPDLHGMATKWLQMWGRQNGVINKLQALGALLEIEFPDDQGRWRKELLDCIKQHILTQVKHQDFLDIYDTCLEVTASRRDQDLIDILNTRAFDAVEQVMKYDRSPLQDMSTRALQIVSEVLMRDWPRERNGRPNVHPLVILLHILTTPNIKSFLKFFTKNEKRLDGLSEDCLTCVAQAESLLLSIQDDLASGDIPLSQLELLLEHQESFLAVAPVLHSKYGEGSMVEMIDRRRKQLNLQRIYKQHFADLKGLCLHIGLVSGFSETHGHHVVDPKINDCCDPVWFDDKAKTFFQDTERKVLYDFTPDDLISLESLLALKKSKIFGSIALETWEAYRRDNHASDAAQVSYREVLQVIKPKEIEIWNDILQKIGEDKLSLSDVNTYFKCCWETEATIVDELKFFLYEKEKVFQQYVDWIVGCRNLANCRHALEVVNETRHFLKLEGDFSVFENVLCLDKDKSADRGSLSKGIILVIETLAPMTLGQIECINTFLKCRPLVDWIQKNVKEPKEVKTLVDLALISAEGQGDLEVTKVSCLHAAVNGFTPLIYNLSTEAGFEELMQRFQDVFSTLKADKSLPKKLEDLNAQLEWLKDVKDAQGDVRLNALKQVAAINTRGIYIVGHRAEKDFETIDDVIVVKVMPEIDHKEKGKGEPMMFSGKSLKDLQSRLMLIAGKGNEDVDTFVKRFDGVTGLAKTYIDLCAAGNILFKTWTASFFCDPHVEANAAVDFFLSDHKLTGRRDTDVTKQIDEVHRFMERCLREWKQYIKNKRTEFPELNHYTTEQLVILCKELAQPNEMKNEVFILLQDVHPRCMMEQLQTAIGEAVSTSKVQESTTSDDVADVVKEMYSMFSPRIVHRALEKCKDDIDQLEYVCLDLENDPDFDNYEDTEGESLTLIQSEDTVNSLTKQFMEHLSDKKSELLEKLEMLWKKFSSSASMSMKDCLSIDHLGLILTALAKRDDLSRPLPFYTKRGQPNLIICPEKDILLTTLSIYMENDKLPLPSRNEVLLCNEETTAEEVDLLVRRAVTDKTGGIFMLANVHLLNYEVACHAERAIEDYTPENSNYQFVVVCSSEQQDQSQLVTALDNYRVHPQNLPSLDSAQQYIEMKLRGKTGASGIDPTGCSIRLVCSDKPGAGKTLWVKRLGETLKERFHSHEGCKLISLPLFGNSVTTATVLESLLPETPGYNDYIPTLYHINIPHEMQNGVDHLLFNLVVLGSLVDSSGRIWRRDPRDLYVIETLPLLCWDQSAEGNKAGAQQTVHRILELLPTVTCRSPKETLDILKMKAQGEEPQGWNPHDQLIDKLELQSEAFQRVYQYLSGKVKMENSTKEAPQVGEAKGQIPLPDEREKKGIRSILSFIAEKLRRAKHVITRQQRVNTQPSLDIKRRKMEFHEEIPENLQQDCLEILLGHCGFEDPTWAELAYFVQFLNVQLDACENSLFCEISLHTLDTLPGFMDFVVRFMIQMSKDFATRSLNIAEDTRNEVPDGADMHEVEGEIVGELSTFQLRRRWETSPHPYIFFNPDNETMTFLGFIVEPPNYDVVDRQTKEIIEKNIMDNDLFDGLCENSVDLTEDFNALPRADQLAKLCMVMGSEPHDPDDKYVLTADNAKKILAIQMRFRCSIPVVIMGETGCGKTYLIKFMCSLQCPPGEQVKNMMLMKVHGGTTEADIIRKVKEAQQLAKTNRDKYPGMFTVLFLDEVNTTEALGLVKEVLCDNSLNGRPLGEDSGLRLVAACNPYRKHTPEVIEKLEKAGLGYHVRAENTSDKLGRIPMRQLVYRVQPLPQSLLPLVWDFGQLQPHAERDFIEQIVKNKMAASEFQAANDDAIKNITNILVAVQTFMRGQKDECSFVSLRDVERTMDVMTWFYNQRDTLFPLMDKYLDEYPESAEVGYQMEDDDSIIVLTDSSGMGCDVDDERPLMQIYSDSDSAEVGYQMEDNEAISDRSIDVTDLMGVQQNNGSESPLTQRSDSAEVGYQMKDDEAISDSSTHTTDLMGVDRNDDNESPLLQVMSHLRRSLILALGVCYHAGLQDKREEFREMVSEHFEGPFELVNGPSTFEKEISVCQDVFLNEIQLQPTIARNQALKENVFMMVVCIELRLPLFLVGKPGSSKSLAKTIVADAMQGPNSHSPFFKKLKQVHLVSYQCSPLSTPDGIVSTFRQCAQLQKNKGDLNKFVAVAVLDEIGLAEDSPKMPLKALHPLLEDGCEGDGEAEDYMKVSFIGISNWALDPAKMNRGILVQRGSIDREELEATTRGICSSDAVIYEHIEPLMQPLAAGYLDLYNKAIADKQEFFGLRDFYSLVKMVFAIAKRINGLPMWDQLEHAVLRNFGGLETADPVKVFSQYFLTTEEQSITIPRAAHNTVQEIICESLRGSNTEGENRYLLVLTENYAALRILQNMNILQNINIIYGSSFSGDQDYVVVCRNINQIKVCMETGQTVVLLNLESLYESLYDVLNQYYTYFGGQRHVDLGLGSHRVKARVHENFKLIVIADKKEVYERFPIPLINRFEKHIVAMSTTMSPEQQKVVDDLSNWAHKLSQSHHNSASNPQSQPADTFIGYHGDTCATVVSHVWNHVGTFHHQDEEVLRRSKGILLQCATPEAVLRVSKTQLKAEQNEIMDTYFKEQNHACLLEYVAAANDVSTENLFIQITTHSRLLSKKHVREMVKTLGPKRISLNSHSLQAFNTKHQFSELLRAYFEMPSSTDQVLLIQCDSGEKNAELIACARFCITEANKAAQEKIDKTKEGHQTKRHVVIIVQLPRVAGGCFVGFQGDLWQSVHLDELHPDKYEMPPMDVLIQQPMSSLIGASLEAEAQTAIPPSPTATVHPHPKPYATHMLNQLLASCVHGATAMLKDTSGQTDSTTRIHKMLALVKPCQVDHREQDGFIEVLIKRIYLLLKDKEDHTTTLEIARSWLCNKVASAEAVNKAGTFRRSLWQYLETRITPIFAAIIAFLDTNNNLKLYRGLKTEHWKERMWLDVFNSVTLSPISYTDLLSAKENTELKEMMVRTTGADGLPMTAQFPFSWLLKSTIDSLMDQKKKAQVGEEDLTRYLGHLLTKTSWWPILKEAFTEAGHAVVRDCYLEDYVRMVYKPRSKEDELKEFGLVKGAIVSAFTQLEEMHIGKAENANALEQILPRIHVAEAAFRSRLQLFTEIVVQKPKVVEYLWTFQQTHPDHPLALEMPKGMDVLSVLFLVEEIQPTYELLRDPESIRKWQHQVEDTSPLVNTILARANSKTIRGVCSYSSNCLTVLKEIQDDWNRLTTVKLFAEIVYPEGLDEKKNITKYGPPFFRKLKGSDFKTRETIEIVEKHLKSVIQNTCGAKLCPSCKDPMTTEVVMPCKHKICEQRLKNFQDAEDFTCLTCKKPYGQETDLERSQIPSEKIVRTNSCKQRCNAFLVDLISRLCFGGNSSPNPDLVGMLMGYITKQPTECRPQAKTQNSLFDNKVSLTPVERSVILQLLLKSSIIGVHEHLVQHFRQAQEIDSETKDKVELAVLYIQCLEDHYFNLFHASNDLNERITQTTRLLEQSLNHLGGDTGEVTHLEAIAKARLGLSVAAEWMIRLHIKKEEPFDLEALHRLFEAAEGLCSGGITSGPSLFLIRQLVRRFSLNEFEQLAETFPWLGPKDKMQATPLDRFVIWGPGYVRIKDALAQSVAGNLETVTDIINCGDQTSQDYLQIALAIFRNITCAYASTDDSQRPSLESLQSLWEMCSSNSRMHQIGFRKLVTNGLSVACPQFKVTPGLSHTDLSLLEIVVHFQTMIVTRSYNKLLHPIAKIFGEPSSLRAPLLPGMPEDTRIGVYETLRAAAAFDYYENPVLYECPNGHTYVIGNCGRPVSSQLCSECGQPIGGNDYTLSEKNRMVVLDDQTKPGHCLGPAASCSLVPTSVRTMSPACTALVRLLVHLGLYTGANKHLQAIHALITPTIRQADVPDFLWQHMLCDLEVLSRAVGKGKDDTLLLVHLLLRDIALSQSKEETEPPEFQTKETRKAWERTFSETIVAPILQDMDARLGKANQEITDESQGGLLGVIHETRAGTADADTNHFLSARAMWRYRTRVTIEHLGQALSQWTRGNGNASDKCVLSLFLGQEPLLGLVQLIPQILELVKGLSEFYHRKVDRSEADALTFQDFETALNDGKRQRYKECFEAFRTAWACVHPYLQSYGVGGKLLPAEFLNQSITEETSLSFILPSERGRGLCVFALLNYLTAVHNDFMRQYHELTKKELRPEVSFPDLTPAHLITYDPDRDLLPLVMANCTYSLEVGQGTKITYDFKRLEQQVEERFIKGKGMLKFKLEPISFREDLNNAALFKSLQRKICQTQLSPAMQSDIRGDARIMVEVSDCLANLDIAIGFLVSVGGDPDTTLHSFMTDTLQMEAGALTPMARQRCKLCHTKALWLLFSHEREKMSLRNNQEPFTSVDSRDYRVPLEEGQSQSLMTALRRMKVDHFLSELHECILLCITIKASQYDEDHVDNKKQRLNEVLYVYIEGKEGQEIAALTNGTFPADIRVEQCVDTWRAACQFMQAASNK